jgi:glycosyltransferase involved in cell wall biosynthesis
MVFGGVVIGRNEGERLKRCLRSLSKCASAVVYVDSGSIDGSAQWARDFGITVLDLDLALPFTAARARNAGFRRLREMAADIGYVQFVDGDCELIQSWPDDAISFLEAHSDIAAVAGRRRELYPERSVYNWLCEKDWNGPSGEVRSCGGDAMMRVSAFESVGGFRDDLIAGEEPELCVRLRAAGWKIWRLETDMTFHDAAMFYFGQWWRRALRGGYAFAQGAYLHGRPPECHRVWEARRAWIWGVWFPLGCLAIGLTFEPWGWATWLIYPLQVLRQIIRNQGSFRDRVVLALFQTIARFPEGWGQIKFLIDRLSDRRSPLIEYK